MSARSLSAASYLAKTLCACATYKAAADFCSSWPPEYLFSSRRDARELINCELAGEQRRMAMAGFVFVCKESRRRVVAGIQWVIVVM